MLSKFQQRLLTLLVSFIQISLITTNDITELKPHKTYYLQCILKDVTNEKITSNEEILLHFKLNYNEEVYNFFL